MAWAFRASSYANNGAGATVLLGATTTITAPTAYSAGDLIVLGITALDPNPPDGPGTFTVSDSVNGSWGSGEVLTKSWVVATFKVRTSIWAFPNSAAGTPVITITLATNANSANIGLQVMAFSGIVTTSPFDTGGSGNAATANASSGAVSPATGAANELMVGFYADGGENITLAVGNINGSTATLAGKHESDASKYEALFEYGDAGSSGGTPTATITQASNTGWAMLAAVFKITGGAAVIPPGLGPVVGMPEWAHLDTAMMR
jgi:hypothetical protein